MTMTHLCQQGRNSARSGRDKTPSESYTITTAGERHRSCGLTENGGHEIAGRENTRYEFARHDKYLMKIDYITLECEFLLNFKFFVCKASVLTYKKT